MSKLATTVSTLVAQLESYESQLDALTAKVTALEARLVKATTADVGFDLVPIRDEATIALAEYRRQLDDVAFAPEADGVTSAMRAEHHAAVDAVDRAASWIAQSGKTREKEIYAAIGAGRKALIRLTAMLERQPVPLSLLTADELSGYRNAETDVHTEDRFRWEGHGDAEFLLDRPVFGRPVFVEVARLGEDDSSILVSYVVRTDRTLGARGGHHLHGLKRVDQGLVGPTITHVRIEAKADWRVRVIQSDELPPMDRETTGRGPARFRHTQGAKKVVMQGTWGGEVVFVPDCDCTDTCRERKHGEEHRWEYFSGAFRDDATLPAGTGMLFLRMHPESVWSVTVLDD
jgi:hypothetical protein